MRYFIIYFSLAAAIISDAFVQYFFPGIFLITPLTLLVLAFTRKHATQDLAPLVIACLIADLFSGFTWGYATLSYIVLLCMIHQSRKWIRIL